MRRGRGLGITSIFVGVIVAGFLFAVLRQFDYDPIAAFQWALNSVFSILKNIADKFTGNEWFRKTFSS